jgi:hypothetical protein
VDFAGGGPILAARTTKSKRVGCSLRRGVQKGGPGNGEGGFGGFGNVGPNLKCLLQVSMCHHWRTFFLLHTTPHPRTQEMQGGPWRPVLEAWQKDEAYDFSAFN